MTAEERLMLVQVKIQRANQHLHDLETEIRAFLGTNPYVVKTKQNAQTRQLIYYVASVRETPITIAAIAGDVLQNLRSALDHLAYQLVLVGTGNKGPFPYVSFPIYDDAEKYKTNKLGKVKSMRLEAVKAIDAVKPYKGGNDTLWRLHMLNNIDKHRLLITVGSAFRSVNMAAFMQPRLRATQPEFANMPAFPDLFIRPADRLFPLKAGDELLIDAPDSKENPHLKFCFEVAFGEAPIIEDEPLLKTLRDMSDLVSNLISSFGPYLV